jgi:hypothetical protein
VRGINREWCCGGILQTPGTGDGYIVAQREFAGTPACSAAEFRGIMARRTSVNKSEKGVPGEVSPQPLPYSEAHRNLRFAGTNRGAEGAITCSRCVETE